MKIVDLIASILLIVGGLNWGLIGLFGFNVVGFLFGGTMLEMVTYILVGASALWQVFCYFKCGRCCGS